MFCLCHTELTIEAPEVVTERSVRVAIEIMIMIMIFFRMWKHTLDVLSQMMD